MFGNGRDCPPRQLRAKTRCILGLCELKTQIGQHVQQKIIKQHFLLR